MSTSDITKRHMQQAGADTLTNQGTGEIRDEALKRSIIILKPSNKGVRNLTFFRGGRNGSLGSTIRRTCFFFRLPQLALKVGDPLLSRAQCRLSRCQLTRWDKSLASLLCLRDNCLKPLIRLLDGGQFLLRAVFRCQSVSLLTLQTLHTIQTVNQSEILSVHPLKFSECALE